MSDPTSILARINEDANDLDRLSKAIYQATSLLDDAEERWDEVGEWHHPAAELRAFRVASFYVARVKPYLTTEGDCWVWTRYKDKGYGQVRFDGHARLVHRIAAEFAYGPIPAGMHVDHLCRNPGCAKPAHLEIVTPRENARRGLTGVLKKTCAQGHPWTPENWAVKGNGMKRCAVCHRERERGRK